MLDDVRSLYDHGFHIHLLRSKSKVPLESGWTTSARKTWAELESAYRPGMNVGVRLGTPLADGYLAVIDVDIKSQESRHRDECFARLKELFPTVFSGPRVTSGRGNASAHFYVLTSALVKSRKIASSSERVKVHMPSVAVTKEQARILTADEVRAGMRLRPAWEIDFMSEGRQVVLPPSIHPDSGRPYLWANPFPEYALPLIEIPESQNSAIPGHIKERGSESFRPVSVNLELSDVDPKIVAMIYDGEGVEDRSASLFLAAIAMVRARLNDSEILTVLTDPDSFLGQVAYEHAKTESRARAARWIADYTLKRARKEADAALVFEQEVEELPPLSDDAAASQSAELTVADWRGGLQRTKDGALRVTLKNLETLIGNLVPGAFIRNEFSNRDIYGRDTPWGGVKGKELKDDDAILIKVWCAHKLGIEPSVNLVHECMASLAMKGRFHPVRDYLNRLEWDGVERIDTWLRDYMGAQGKEPYLSAVSRKTLCAMVARVFVPGIKFDTMPIFEGKQGVGKSTAARILAGEAWFSDTLPDVRDKDAMLNLLGAWVVEVSELATLKRADSETYKSFFSRQADRVRAPYGRRWEEYLRQCVFIGTTNAADYLKDKTGNRRFWPVEVGACDFKKLARDRDQLFAEAKWTWENLGEDLYLKNEEKEQAEEVQASRVAEDEEASVSATFNEWVRGELTSTKEDRFDFGKSFRMVQLFDHPGSPFSVWKFEYPYYLWATSALKNSGFENFGVQGVRKWRLKREKRVGGGGVQFHPHPTSKNTMIS